MMAQDKSIRRNPFHVLSSLGPVLETRDIEIAMDFSRKGATEAMSRWMRSGYVKPFSFGICFNVVAYPKSPQTHVFEAASRALRRPVALIGASALHTAGWTTQMPTGYELAIACDRNVRRWKRMEGITAEARSTSWFAAVIPYLLRTPNGFDRLPPALALVDAIASEEKFALLSPDDRREHHKNGTVTWHPHADDISLPLDREPEEIWREIVEAAEILEVPYETVRDYALGIPELSDIIDATSAALPRPGY